MSARGGKRTSTNARFFYHEITSLIPSLESLLQEAYILVKHCRFNYDDVKSMTRLERIKFMEFLRAEKEQEKNELERI